MWDIVPISETRSGEIGTPKAYGIHNGNIVTTLGHTPLEMAVFKSDEAYLAVRSDEFGYANYEIVPTPDRLGREGMERAPGRK